MTSANRTQILVCRETTAGTTPTTPRMRTMRMTGESLNFTPEYVDPDEIRSDRMLDDPIKVMQASTGGINFELSYPTDEGALSEIYRSAFFNAWVNTPTRDNDGVADSVITNIATTGGVATVVTGAAFVAGQLVRFTNFTNSVNNGVFQVTTGSATVPAFVTQGLIDETAPPATARMKVVGFFGAVGDIDATSTGLTSTSRDFTAMGLAVGQWIKIGGGAGTTFGTAANNDWARITAIAANVLTLDNLPTGWAADTSDSSTIYIWFGDQIRNGTTQTSLSIEKGFLGQTVPTYIVNTGMEVNTLEHNFTSRQKVTGTVDFMGMGGSQSTVALDASPDAATTGVVMAANANVGRLAENGATLTSPNWARSATFVLANNLRAIDAVDDDSPVGVNEGECGVTGTMESYFGDNVLLAKIYAGTASAINLRVTKNSQALIFQVPRATFKTGNPAVSGKNTDVMLSISYTGSKDTTTNSSILLDRIEYFL